MNNKRALLVYLFLIVSTVFMYAQSSIKVRLIDKSTGDPVEFATVYITLEGQKDPTQFTLSNDQGKASFAKIANGKYTLKAELLGYKAYSESIVVKDKDLDLGTLKMTEDATTLNEAKVSAVGNTIVVKKDTIEYNAESFKPADNDMLISLLKKMPGIEVSSDGTVTANGKEVKEITIDGKTFFLDDPSIATNNIPAKIVKKVKVIERKSKQAQFTGIDDGNEDTIIDLSLVPGMMKGLFGNASIGGGYDIPVKDGDARFQGAALAGYFTEDTQISVIANGNNTNNRGFHDMASSMMSSMRGGRGGGRGMSDSNSGVTTSWMGGANVNSTLLDGALEFGANYLYNGSDKDIETESSKTTFLTDSTSMKTISSTKSSTNTSGNRAGGKFEYTISDNTSIIFEPQFNFSSGDFNETTTSYSYQNQNDTLNSSDSKSTGSNDNSKAYGELLLRQKLGKAGRTISLDIDYSLSQNDLDGYNYSTTLSNNQSDASVIDQYYNTNQDSYSLSGNLVYTEPLGNNYFLELSYKYKYSENNSDKYVYNMSTSGNYDELDTDYSNKLENSYVNQRAGVSVTKQEDKYRLQLGMNLEPSYTKSIITDFSDDSQTELTQNVLNYAPRARFEYDFSKSKSLRLDYRGSTNQPTVTQLQTVADNSNPLLYTLGNDNLKPEFSNSLRTMYRSTNMSTFRSMFAFLTASYTKDNIVYASLYNDQGVQFRVPLNSDEATYSLSGRGMYNVPFQSTNLSVSSYTSASVSSALNYTGNYNGTVSDLDINSMYDDLTAGRTTYMNLGETLYLNYNSDNIYARIGGSASYSDAWYDIASQAKSATWTNYVAGEISATLPWDLQFKTDYRYTYYIGFDDGYANNTNIWNAQISKGLFNNKFSLQAKIYDILNQSQTAYRTTTNNYMEDVSTNALGQYFMITLTWKFGNMNNMSKMGNSRRGRRGPGGGHGPF